MPADPLIFPHPPFVVEEPWYSLHDRTDVPLPFLDTTAGRPGFHAEIRNRYQLDRLTSDDWSEIVAVYYGMTSRVDDQLGRVLDAVERAGQRSSTVTAFFTDHGEYLGDFGMVEKWPAGLEDCLVHNPLVIHDPNGRSGVATGLTEMIDLTATLLELAEVEPDYTHFGRSLRPLLGDPTTPHRSAAFSEGGFLADEGALLEPDASGHYRHKQAIQHELTELVGKVMAVRTDNWTFVERLYEGPELYDRRTDPSERDNLLAAPEPGTGSGTRTGTHADVVAEHRLLLARWMLETSDVFPWTPDPRMETVLRQSLRP